MKKEPIESRPTKMLSTHIGMLEIDISSALLVWIAPNKPENGIVFKPIIGGCGEGKDKEEVRVSFSLQVIDKPSNKVLPKKKLKAWASSELMVSELTEIFEGLISGMRNESGAGDGLFNDGIVSDVMGDPF